MITAHPVEDQEKLKAITLSMMENGWQGAPVVICDDIQITGVHRAAAAEAAGIEMETITLQEIFEEDGADFEEALSDYNDSNSDDIYIDIMLMLDYLSDDIKAKYAIDLH